MINTNRLAATFKHLVEIDSISKEEAGVSNAIIKAMEPFDARIFIDNAGEKTGGNTGNLIIKIKGEKQVPPLLISAHMDTVEPGRGIKAVLKNGLFTSKGKTVLGADDKSAIAIIIETINVLKENNLPHGPLELLFTVCEEIGLSGAKHLDYDLITARFGYVLDSTEIGGIATRAPAANRLKFVIHGKDAHAGAFPERGINAICLASRAIEGLKTGRIDHETTCNIGMINGGVATNIVPGKVTVQGETRSHNQEKLDGVTNHIVDAFKSVVENEKKLSADTLLPKIDITVENDFPFTNIPDDHIVVKLVMQAGRNLGKKITARKTGGGSDANIFYKNGIITGVLGTGMRDVHTLRESIRVDDMTDAAMLLIEIIKLHSKGD